MPAGVTFIKVELRGGGYLGNLAVHVRYTNIFQKVHEFLIFILLY